MCQVLKKRSQGIGISRCKVIRSNPEMLQKARIGRAGERGQWEARDGERSL